MTFKFDACQGLISLIKYLDLYFLSKEKIQEYGVFNADLDFFVDNYNRFFSFNKVG